MTLRGRHVVVIGGSSGMGLATAGAAAAEGAKVTIVSSDEGRLNAALTALPHSCQGFVVDTRREPDVRELFAETGELDHLVYTAGDPLKPKSLSESTLEEARQFFEVRFWGAVAAVKYAAPKIRPHGSIVLTSGTVGFRPLPQLAIAASGAGAVVALAKSLAVELTPIRVNAVAPGIVRTPPWSRVLESQQEAQFASLAERTLTKSVGEADDIATTHLYLMKNRFVTGTVLTVDGGAVLV